MGQKKFEVIISRSKTLLDAIESNLLRNDKTEILLVDQNNSRELPELPKIDILILDELPATNIPLYKVNNIINLTGTQLSSRDIVLKKPLRLLELLDIIKLEHVKNQIYCRINNQWIYDEQMGKLVNQTSTIRLTEKENEIFKYLLLAENYKVFKDNLFEKVWNYNQASNSTTFETHMSRLKQKLPQDLLQFKNNCYELIIMDIV